MNDMRCEVYDDLRPLLDTAQGAVTKLAFQSQCVAMPSLSQADAQWENLLWSCHLNDRVFESIALTESSKCDWSTSAGGAVGHA